MQFNEELHVNRAGDNKEQFAWENRRTTDNFHIFEHKNQTKYTKYVKNADTIGRRALPTTNPSKNLLNLTKNKSK